MWDCVSWLILWSTGPSQEESMKHTKEPCLAMRKCHLGIYIYSIWNFEPWSLCMYCVVSCSTQVNIIAGTLNSLANFSVLFQVCLDVHSFFTDAETCDPSMLTGRLSWFGMTLQVSFSLRSLFGANISFMLSNWNNLIAPFCTCPLLNDSCFYGT